MLKKTALALASAAMLLTACSDDKSTIESFDFYVSDGASLFTVNSADSLNIDKKEFVGLNGGTLMYAMDFNPRAAGTAVVSTGLSGLGSDGQSYSIDTATGALTLRGTPDTTVSLNNKAVEIDYNPRAAIGAAGEGRVYRVTSSTGDNYRRQSDSGAKVATDAAFVYVTGDANAGKSVVVSALAYTNSGTATTVPGTTIAYVLDSQNDVLSVLGGTSLADRNAQGGACPGATANPDCGQLRTVGKLGLDISGFVGFDVINADKAYATAFANGTYNLYSVDLARGQMTFVTAINPKVVPVRSFAVVQPAR